MPFTNPSSAEIKALLEKARTIAVVGLSSDPDRPSYSVAMYLQTQGYRIVPVRPGGGELFGEKVYARLSEIPFPIDLVDVFRRKNFLAGHIEETLSLKLPAIWAQEGVTDEAACAQARRAGLFVAQDLCVLKEHRRVGLSKSIPPPQRR